MIEFLPAVAAAVYPLTRARDARKDFAAFLAENDLTQEQMDAAMETMPAPIADNAALTHRAPSIIHGLGIVANQLIPAGTVAAIAFTKGQWTTTGRYANHSKISNVSPRRNAGSIELVATQDIHPNQEIVVDYRTMKQSMEGA